MRIKAQVKIVGSYGQLINWKQPLCQSWADFQSRQPNLSYVFSSDSVPHYNVFFLSLQNKDLFAQIINLINIYLIFFYLFKFVFSFVSVWRWKVAKKTVAKGKTRTQLPELIVMESHCKYGKIIYYLLKQKA